MLIKPKRVCYDVLKGNIGQKGYKVYFLIWKNAEGRCVHVFLFPYWHRSRHGQTGHGRDFICFLQQGRCVSNDSCCRCTAWSWGRVKPPNFAFTIVIATTPKKCNELCDSPGFVNYTRHRSCKSNITRFAVILRFGLMLQGVVELQMECKENIYFFCMPLPSCRHTHSNKDEQNE